MVVSPLSVRAGHSAGQTAPARPSGTRGRAGSRPARKPTALKAVAALRGLTTSVSNGGADSD